MLNLLLRTDQQSTTKWTANVTSFDQVLTRIIVVTGVKDVLLLLLLKVFGISLFLFPKYLCGIKCDEIFHVEIFIYFPAYRFMTCRKFEMLIPCIIYLTRVAINLLRAFYCV